MSEYETKDSGRRIEFDSGMKRDIEDDKPAFHLIIPKGVPYKEQMLTRWAGLMQRGKVKYGPRNWELAKSDEELERFKASALRHMIQWLNGEDDEDHASAVFFNVQAAEYVKWRKKSESS